MHYQHRYHAGNFADVFKHVVLLAVVEALSRKPAPWCYYETHAGAGLYDLRDVAALRTGEAADGVLKLVPAAGTDALLQRYIDVVLQLNAGDGIAHYPGSPLFVAAQARESDRLVLCERVPKVADELRLHCHGDRRISIHQRDGYELPGLLPPAEKRGLVLIDPPFERADEFRAMIELLRRSLQRFAHGVYLLWYPLKNHHAADKLQRAAAALGREGLDLRFETGAKGEGQMRGCGVLLLNPPYGVLDALRAPLDVVCRALARGPNASWTSKPF